MTTLEEALAVRFAGNHYADGRKITELFDFSEHLFRSGDKENSLRVYNYASVEGMGFPPVEAADLERALFER